MILSSLTNSCLTKAWLLLLGMTFAAMGAAMWAGSTQGHPLPQPAAAGLIIGVAGLKAWMILAWYLGLRTAPAGWRIGFTTGMLVLCGALFVVQIIGWRMHP